MPKIRDIIGGLTEEQLSPTPPEIIPPAPQGVEEMDLSQELVLEVTERLTKPWQYGQHLQRFARQCDTTLEIVKAIKKELDTRIKINAKAKEAKEPTE
jgi:hypothetical protein